MSDCSTELEYRTINGGSPQIPLQGPGRFLIQKNLATCIDVLEVCCQPNGQTNLQIIEGGSASSTDTSVPPGSNPVSAFWNVQSSQPWSAPGKRIKNDLYLIISAAVTVQVEVRYTIPCCQQ